MKRERRKKSSELRMKKFQIYSHNTLFFLRILTNVVLTFNNFLLTVRSFGTEDRETPYPIPPQPTVYDYILFRGSDIKDIRVINNVAIPNDPAIMQMHLPPQQNFSQNFSPMQHSNTSQSFGPFGHMSGNLPSSIGQNLVPSQQQQPSSQQQNHSPIRQQQGNDTLGREDFEMTKSKKPNDFPFDIVGNKSKKSATDDLRTSSSSQKSSSRIKKGLLLHPQLSYYTFETQSSRSFPFFLLSSLIF